MMWIAWLSVSDSSGREAWSEEKVRIEFWGGGGRREVEVRCQRIRVEKSGKREVE